MAKEKDDVFIDEHFMRISGGCSEECQPFLGDEEENPNLIPVLNTT